MIKMCIGKFGDGPYCAFAVALVFGLGTSMVSLFFKKTLFFLGFYKKCMHQRRFLRYKKFFTVINKRSMKTQKKLLYLV